MSKRAAVCGLWVLFVLPSLVPLSGQDQQSPGEGQAPSGQTSTEETKPAKPKRIYPITKYELAGGYAFRTYYSPFESSTMHLNGWFASLDYNRFTWLGFTGEAVGTGINQSGINNINGGLYGNTTVYTFLVGPQVYPFRHHKVTPFGHFLIGLGFYRNVTSSYGGFPGGNHDSLVRAWEAGGGLDLALREHWTIRLIQVDTTSANFFSNTSTYANRSLIRFSVGVSYHFGKR
jgi:hypothetical protein